MQSAPRSRQITMPAPHYSVFYRPDALPAAQPTASKHWRHETMKLLLLLLLHPFNGLHQGQLKAVKWSCVCVSRTTWVSQYQKGKTSQRLNEARNDGVWGCSGISWTICKQYAPWSRQITISTPHHSVFTGQMLFLTTNQQCQSTKSKTV